MSTGPTKITPRSHAIDQFRGLAIILMVLANYLAGVVWIPAWLKHAPDIGLTVIDLIAPFFIFAIGLTYASSFRRRLGRDGTLLTVQHFVTRWMALIGIGSILSAGEIAFHIAGRTVNWGVLQAIGAAGLVTLPLLWLKAGWRMGAGLALLGIYQVLLDRFWLQTVLAAPHGGLFGSLGWAAMLVISTALADWYHQETQRPRWFTLASLLVLAAGFLLAFVSPISKNRVSASYVLVSTGASALLFLCFWFASRFERRFPLLEAWGQNPLLLYILHMLLIGLFFLPGVAGWYAQAPFWLVLGQAAFLLVVLSWIALALKRRDILIAL